ncbi:hypothetical protein AB6806_28540 [Bosea sp. RCC_152_1]|uniref:hypothetical protein n=1 Tax=Bosea sp. RCC_152_1 TaxID=3239228 RepID=UPI0035256AA9
MRNRLGGFDATCVAELRVEVYTTALQYDSPNPTSDLAARFSFRHAAALALRFGSLPHDGFAIERLRHSEIEAIAAKVVLQADPRLDALYPANRPGRVTLVLSNGIEESAEVLMPKGDGARALTQTELDTKASNLIDSAWGQGHYSTIRGLIDSVEETASRTVSPDPREQPPPCGRFLFAALTRSRRAGEIRHRHRFRF